MSIDVPVLCLMSARSDLSTAWNEDMRRADTVLDVERLASAAIHLGAHVTVARIDGGLHDLV
ncbi:alpha/beta hydrolase, partial [Pseudomonas sp. GW456-R21]